MSPIRGHKEFTGQRVNGPTDYSWMRAVLESLFDDVPKDRAIEAIRSAEAFHLLREELDDRLSSGGRPGIIPPGDYGDNLLMALLALRTKFSRQEAAAKLETNISMRERRGRGVSSQ
jgi:hypothetical protein